MLTITDKEDIIITSLTTNTEVTSSSDEYKLSEVCAIINLRRHIKSKELMCRRRLIIRYHHGRIQVIPPIWNFPKNNYKQLIDN